MTRAWDNIRDIDLMAYADGLLDADPAHKAAVEAYLKANPADAARVREIIQDNEAIRQIYAGELERPVPQRLLRTVHEPEAGRRRAPSAIAAGIALVALAGTGGWFIAEYGNRATIPQELLAGVAQRHTEDGRQMAMGTAANPSVSGTLISAPSRNAWIEIPLPDLSMHEFELAERKRVTVADRDMMRLVYRSADTTLNLFMYLRKDADDTSIRRTEAEGIAVHHWSAGPIGYAMTFDRENGNTGNLSEIMRSAVRNGRFIDQIPGTGGGGASVASEEPPGPQELDAPSPPLQRQFN